MSFGTPFFLFFFFPAALILERLLPGLRAKNRFLALAGLLFVAFGQLACVPVLLASVLLNYLAGQYLGKHGQSAKPVLIAAVTLNVALLAGYKYTGFVVENLNALLHCAIPVPQYTLPVGISFFTFQGISYLVDIYRGDEAPAASLTDCLLYFTFFPRFRMGPIVRYRDFVPQLRERSENLTDTARGLRRVLTGLFKNTVMAGTLGAVADAMFRTLQGSSGLIDCRLAWVGAVFYALELYLDFSGYSDMALGLSAMFGFRLKENFAFPYSALSIRDFWRRWHISLSTWFKDYVYIPLGGSRKGKGRAALNRMAVFLLTGLWHGANWTFIVWGICHGVLANLEDLGVIPVKKLEKSTAGRLLCRVYTLLAAVLLFVIFRADTLADGGRMLASLFCGGLHAEAGLLLARQLSAFGWFMLAVALLISGPLIPWLRQKRAEKGIAISAAAEVCGTIGALLLFGLACLYIAQGNFSPSIYAQF